jgi:hypothetical protein
VAKKSQPMQSAVSWVVVACRNQAVRPGERRPGAVRRLAEKQTRQVLADLLRDVFGNPFRPAAVAPTWLAWHGETVPKLAQSVYDERAFERLPILADALEEAGCADAALLGHLRSPGPHARGCWALDLLLGKP